MKILLVNVNTCVSPYPVFPLGIAHLAAALEAAGHTVRLHDINLDRDLEKAVAGFNPGLIGLSLRNIDDVQIESATIFSPILAAMTLRIRAVSAAPVVLGGSGYSLFPERLVADAKADYGIPGEGERSLALLVNALEGSLPFAAVPGLVHRLPSGSLVSNKREALSPELIPIPVRQADIASFYLDKSAMLNVQTQRGCSFTCCYCTYPVIEGTTFRRRPAVEVAEDFIRAKAAGARYLFVVDSVFNSSEEHVRGICDELIRRDAQIDWGCFLRPEGLTVELMQLMRRAGLRHIEFGTDTLTDETLAAYGKGFTFDDVVSSSEAARQAGVHYAHFLITGGPAETEATIREGFENAKRIKKTIFFPFVGMRLYPGTHLYAWAEREGTLPKDHDFLMPWFYVSPHVNAQRCAELLRGFHKEEPRWMVGETPPELLAVMDGLRKRGVTGPLWEFLAR